MIISWFFFHLLTFTIHRFSNFCNKNSPDGKKISYYSFNTGFLSKSLTLKGSVYDPTQMFYLIPCKSVSENIKLYKNLKLQCYILGSLRIDYLALCEKYPYLELFWFVFSSFGLNMERCFVSLRIQSECGKIRTRILRIRTFFTQCWWWSYGC